MKTKLIKFYDNFAHFNKPYIWIWYLSGATTLGLGLFLNNWWFIPCLLITIPLLIIEGVVSIWKSKDIKITRRNKMTTDTTNYYERDDKGQWWIVSSGDFLPDIKQRTEAPYSVEMEIAFQMGGQMAQVKLHSPEVINMTQISLYKEYRAGRKEVVDWINLHSVIRTVKEPPKIYVTLEIPTEVWQSQLKEWGIEKEKK